MQQPVPFSMWAVLQHSEDQNMLLSLLQLQLLQTFFTQEEWPKH
jgi:hypothetical protein